MNNKNKKSKNTIHNPHDKALFKALENHEYVIDVYPVASYEVLVEEIKRYLSKELGDEAMTIAQKLEQRGRQQGVQQGVQQGMQQGMQLERYAIAQKMLIKGYFEDLIVEMTNISSHEIKKLKEELGLVEA